MANQQEAGKWPEDFDDSQFKSGSKIKQFLITFIKNFISVLQEMSNMLELQIELKSGIIADSTSQFLDGIKSFLLAVSHDGLYNIAKGNEIIQRLIDEITERRDRKFIKKIIDRLSPNKDSIKLAISIMACDLVRIYEQQISIISGYSDNYYVKKFANDMVKVIIRYILNEEDSPPEKPTDIAKFVIPCLFNPNFAKKKWFKIKKGSELEIVLQENGKLKKINSPDLIINTGIRVKVNNSFKCYDLSHGGKIALYGFRQLSFFSIGNHKDIVNGINDITHQININDQSLYQYKSKLSGNLDMESFIHYAEQVLNVATQKDRFEITATVNDDQINVITTLLTEDISNLINDKMDTFKIYLKEAFGKEMKEMKEILEKIAKYQDLITNEKFILTNSIEEISKAFNIHTKKMIENLEKAGTERKQILALNLRIEQKLDGLVNQIQSNPTDASGLNQPNRNISQESDSKDTTVISKPLLKDLLKNFPIVPDSHYIRREKWITKICDQLKEIGTNGGQVLIYGSPGIGKTVAVAQAVERSVIELGHFQSYKAYWLDIGKINEDQLAEKLKSLYQILSGSKVFSNELPSILDNINRLFEEDKKVGNNLFVFDDIWHPSYYDYFKFAKKSIATSREINPNNKLQPSIEISEGFTDIEVREVFKKYEKIENAEICKEDPWIDDIIIASGGLPLAIGLIGGLGLRTNEQWKNALNSIRDAKCPIKIPNYENNLWGTVELSIKNLGEHEQKFRQLGAFKYPKVSIDSITSLWQCEKEVGQSILRKFHSKSLLKSLDYESDNCHLHNMMLSHLQVLNSEEQTQETYEQSLNKKLFEGYLWRCNGKWSQYPETDVYFYHNIIDHAIKANNHELLKSLMSDFHWMSVKLKVFQTIYKLCIDIEKYIKYLASRKEDNENYKILLSLLRQHEYYLDLESKDLVQFLLIIAFNNDSTWITNMATTLASQCSESGKYWMIAGHTREETVTSNWMESKTIGTSQSDTIPRYCVREDGLSIINARKITDAKFAIKIQDYDTGEIKFDLPVSKRNIKEVKISADGNWLAFLMHISQVHTWEVYDKNGLKRLQFKKDENVTPDWKSNILEFLPLEFIPFKNQPIVAQLITVDGRKDPLLWKIHDSQIEFRQELKLCSMWIERIKFVSNPKRNAYRPLLWGEDIIENFQTDDQNKKHNHECIPKCRIILGNISKNRSTNEADLQSSLANSTRLILPLHFPRKAGLDTNTEAGERLRNIDYIYKKKLIVVRYKKALGYLPIKHQSGEPMDLTEKYTDQFKLVFFSEDNIASIAISADQQFIAVLMYWKIVIIKLQNDSICYYETIYCVEKIHDITFVPGMSGLFAYDKVSKQRLYRFTINDNDAQMQEAKLPVFDLESEKFIRTDHIIIDTSHVFSDNVPVALQLIKYQKEKCCYLKLFQGENLEQTLMGKLQQNYNRCFLHENYKSIILFRNDLCKSADCLNEFRLESGLGTEHWHITLAKISNYRYLNKISNNQADERFINYSMAYGINPSDYNIPTPYQIEDTEFNVLASRYRESDDTIIFIIEIKYIQRNHRLIIFTANCQDETSSIYSDTKEAKYENIQIVYFDENCLITHQHIQDSQNTSQSTIDIYKLNQTNDNEKLYKSHKYQREDIGVISKLVIHGNELSDEIDVDFSPFKDDHDILSIDFDLEDNIDDILQQQFEKEYSLTHCTEYFIIQKENGILVIAVANSMTKILTYCYSKEKHYNFEFVLDLKKISNLWSSQRLAFITDKSQIHIYDKCKIQLLQVIQSPINDEYSEISGNENQSSFICRTNDREYIVFKAIQTANQS